MANMADLMSNVKRAQELVKAEGAKVQEELAAYAPLLDADARALRRAYAQTLLSGAGQSLRASLRMRP